MKVVRWSIFFLALVLAFVMCAGTAVLAYWYGQSQTSVAPAAACVVTQRQQPAVPPQACQPAQDMGPEMAFPGKVAGPAIAEIYNPDTGLCGLVKINEGESFNWSHSGAWWQAPSQEFLDVRWPHHKAEYVAKPSNSACEVYISAGDVPAQ